MILIFFYILISLGHFIFYWYFSTNSATGCKNLDSMFPCAQRLWRFVKTRWNISVVTMLMFDVVREQHFSLVWFPSDQWPASQLQLSDCKWDGRRQLFKGQHTGLVWGGGGSLVAMWENTNGCRNNYVTPASTRGQLGFVLCQVLGCVMIKCQIVFRGRVKRKCALFIDKWRCRNCALYKFFQKVLQ